VRLYIQKYENLFHPLSVLLENNLLYVFFFIHEDIITCYGDGRVLFFWIVVSFRERLFNKIYTEIQDLACAY